MVVWVDAAAEVSTIRISSLDSVVPSTAAEDRAAEHRQHVAGVCLVRQPDPLRCRRRRRHCRDDDDDVGDQQQHRRDDRRAARGLVLVLGFLVDRDGRVPAPVDEQHQDDPAEEGRERQVGRDQPADARMHRRRRVMPGPDLDQRGHREHHEHDELDAQEYLLEVRRDLDAAIADIGHRNDPDDAHEQHPAAGRVGPDGAVRALDQQEHVLTRDLRQAGHDQDVSRDDAPAADPAGLRAERPASPR